MLFLAFGTEFPNAGLLPKGTLFSIPFYLLYFFCITSNKFDHPGARPHLQVPGVTGGRGSVFKAHSAGPLNVGGT